MSFMIDVKMYRFIRAFIVFDAFRGYFFLENISILRLVETVFVVIVVAPLSYFFMSHDINKYSDWIKQVKEFPRGDVGEVSHISQSPTQINGRNLSILSVKYKDFEVSFPGCDPDFAFKYRVGDAINIKVHETDDQRFVPAEFSKMK